MATFTNSEGLVITHTNELLETILSQLNASNTYYTTGEHDVICIEIGSNIVLLLDHTYQIHINSVHTYTINEHTINYYILECILNGTSNEYDLQ